MVKSSLMWDHLGKIAIIATIVGSILGIILFFEQSTTFPKVAAMLSSIPVSLLELTITILIFSVLWICLWRQNILKKQIEDHISATAPALLNSEIFIIEKTYAGMLWQEAGNRAFSPLPNEGTIPQDADLFLHIRAMLTARPPRLIEKIELDLAGHRLIDRDWKTQRITDHEMFLFFPIPSVIPLKKHQVHLIIGIREKDGAAREKKSQVFDVAIARSLHDFHALSGTS